MRQTCTRCGGSYQRLDGHLRMCVRLPVPAELAERFLADETLTVERLRDEFSCCAQVILDRLALAGLDRESVVSRGRRLRARRPKRSFVARQYMQPVDGRERVKKEEPTKPRRCRGCDILYPPPNEDGLCIFCAAAQAGIRSYKDIANSPLVFVVGDLA
ncbi:MAG: hypothetical protein L0332_23515 [Chloroflexi bacterium]|nr:hypothetical protein [Chloroflexota bacterium]